MVKLKEGKISPQYLVSLRRVQGLDQIIYKEGELRIGSLVTHRMLELSPIIRKEFPILTDAVTHIGSVQIRNVATIGGNIVNAVPSADGAIPLITLGAQVRLRGPKGERTMALEEIFIGPGQTLLEPGETPRGVHRSQTSAAHGRRLCEAHPEGGHGAASAGGCGAALPRRRQVDVHGGEDRPGGAGADPHAGAGRRSDSQGAKITEKLLRKAGKAAAEECKARDSIRGEAWYRREMVEVLVPRMARLAMERAK